MTEQPSLGLALDTASELAGVALLEDGLLLAETTWRTRQNHSRELLPSLEWLLSRTGRGKEEIGAVFVCIGPGSYAGLRVGLSTAKALAFGLDAPLVGVGRLEADAEPLLAVTSRRVVTVHAAGRAELAWAAYQRNEKGLVVELEPPQLASLDALLDRLQPSEDIVCADLRSLDAITRERLAAACTLTEAPAPRVLAVGRIGHGRLVANQLDDPEALVPLYLRAPAIGPQS